ncbi:MAG: peptidoglycan-binding protein, partial [Verrucomicrobiales bacterium]|nr:peptidoglycan-binding protein [Verrucomicrobiales bacterium]
MARRRPRPAPPPRRSARGVLPWLGVLGVATLLGWVWWRAAYRPTAAASWAWADTWSGMRTWVDGLFPERRGTVEEEPAEEGGWGTDPSEAEAAGPTIPAIASPRLPGVQVPPSQRSSAVEEGRFVLTNAVSIPVAVDTGNVANPSTPASGVGETPDLRSSELARKEGTNILTVQLALARRGISAGPIDGVVGSQTRAALRVFQKMEGLPVTGV